MIQTRNRKFAFSKGDIVLAKYQHEIFYAKILKIVYRKKYAKLLFDDESIETIPFQHIYDVNETTSNIICVVCKKGTSFAGNDIVLCDQCNIGYHQTCHDPIISSDVLKPEIPWECCYCSNKIENPHVESNPFEDKINEYVDDGASMNSENTEDSNEDSVLKEGFEKESKEEGDDNVFEENNNTEDTKIDYGEQVVIASTDSTSMDEEDEDEDLIIDVESDDDCQVPRNKTEQNFENVCSFKSIDFLKHYLENKKSNERDNNNSVTNLHKNDKDINKYEPSAIDTIVTQSLERSVCRLSTTILPSNTETLYDFDMLRDTCQTKIYKPKIHDRCCSDTTQYSSRKTRIFHPYYQTPNSEPGRKHQWWSSTSEYISERAASESSYDAAPTDVYVERPSSEMTFEVTTNKCVTCGNASDLLCSDCRNISYCSRQCQLDDWNEHYHECNVLKYH